MRSDPTNRRYWLWEIEQNILVFLIRRYGGRSGIDPGKSFGHVLRAGPPIHSQSTGGASLMSSEARKRIRGLLADLQSANAANEVK
jgi:hypothetical protein